MDFNRYKPRLKEYLEQKGVDVEANPTRCFNRLGHRNNDANPSMQLWDDSFKCFGCGIEGDIYDAVEHFEGIKDYKRKFSFLNHFFL